MKEIILQIKQLQVHIHSGSQIIYPVNTVDLTLHKGEIFALVGESGCGKSMTALAINRLLPNNAHMVTGSEVYLDNIPLHQISEVKMQQIRGERIGMIFQDPGLALNPVLNIGQQMRESLNKRDRQQSKDQITQKIIALLEKVRVPDPEICINQYPHQLSGGMKQRVVIAMALAKSPDLLIADEPTTALDVTTQAQVLNLIKELQQQMNMAILLITHDLGVVAQMADTVGVMYAGHLVECASKVDFLQNSSHPYSQKLFEALPENNVDRVLATIKGQVPSLDTVFHLCRFKDRCPYVFKACEEVAPQNIEMGNQHRVRCHWFDKNITQALPQRLNLQAIKSATPVPQNESVRHRISEFSEQALVMKVSDLKVHFPIKRGLFKRTVGYVKAVDNLSFELFEGETLALVGESGCGKTTVGKAILRLLDEGKGSVEFHEQDLLRLSKRKLKRLRGDLQMIFQDPYSAMDPRMRVGEIIEEGMIALKVGSNKAERHDRIVSWLERVGLSENLQQRYPHELSGGQRQRVAIARALAVGAQVLICDEPTSALDLSVQAQILNLLRDLQDEFDISYLFITHNMGVVNYLADTVAVMYLGRIVEYGTAEQVLKSPKHPYTQALLAAVPTLDPKDELNTIQGDVPSPSHPPKGCHFSPRCPFVHARCLEAYPPNYKIDPIHQVKCYLYDPKLL